MPNKPMQPSRRAVLKVGAHAAWAVPAIQVVAAAPAFAAANSIVRSQLAVKVTNVSPKGNSQNVNVDVSYSASVVDAQNVVLTLSSPILEQDYSFTVGPLTAGAVAQTYQFKNAKLVSKSSTGTITVSINGDTVQTATTDVVKADGTSADGTVV